MGQCAACCSGSDAVGVAETPFYGAGARQAPPAGVAEIERRNQLLDRFEPTDVQLLRQRFVEAKGDADALSRQAFTSLFELEDMPKEAREAAFRMFDVDGSGQISFREFCWAMGVCVLSGSDERLRLIFDLFDFDKDGQLPKAPRKAQAPLR
ncbi:hypothetical protein FNF29_05513 [Cafeteria roenbergensis]|uniref:EF-hand domain-containing protein n=1 Tax=Cafeteria roenbergensis TaxID=33653 RepID=A0A5A8CAC0_CAFRO|nr:hypothetical protein FNF29_05513 [Cafeteria roenbergensis]|eukprot:KAA0150073.1 hypothetical protein FNF29_05513 [Cafeteria roenbergensis]